MRLASPFPSKHFVNSLSSTFFRSSLGISTLRSVVVIIIIVGFDDSKFTISESFAIGLRRTLNTQWLSALLARLHLTASKLARERERETAMTS